MKIYEAAGGVWVGWNGIEKSFYATFEEAKMASDKQQVLTEVQQVVNWLNEIDELLTYINANGYGSGQDNAFADSDAQLLKANLGAADVSNALNLLLQVNTLMKNGTPAQGDYTSIVDKFRSRS